MSRVLGTVAFAIVSVVTLGTGGSAYALCAVRTGDPEPPTTFVGIARGKDLDGPREPFWPHRFRVEEVERGLDGFEPGDVIDVDLAVNERFEGGMAMWIEDNLGDAPLVGGRYRVGVYSSDAPEGVRYHANGCGGFLTRLPDPAGAEPHRQTLPTGDPPSNGRMPNLEVEGKPETAPLPRPMTISAGVALGSVSAGLIVHGRRRAAGHPGGPVDGEGS